MWTFLFYEKDETTGKIDFSHNPFSMPQGGLEALNTQDPLTINAYQYDIVCNGIELSSGAIRNHLPEVMYKAFDLVGYSKEEVETRFGGLLNAFKFGAPPHGGCAPGIDRIVMMLANEPNLREIIAFPLNQQAQDLLMQAPSVIEPERLKELCLEVKLPFLNKGTKSCYRCLKFLFKKIRSVVGWRVFLPAYFSLKPLIAGLCKLLGYQLP